MLVLPIIALIGSIGVTMKCIREENIDGTIGWITVSIVNIISIVNILSA